MAAVAQKMPAELTLRMMDGQERMLSEYRGRIVVLQVMSTRCGGCVRKIKLLNDLQETFGNDCIQPIAVAINTEAPEMIEEFIERSGPRFPVALSSKQNVCEFAGLPQAKPLFLPVILFIDREGVVRGLSCPGTDFFTEAETTFPAMIRRLEGQA